MKRSVVPDQYRLKISATLMTQLATVGVDPDSLVEFANAQIQTLIESKPNHNMFKDKKIWILRGFYPDTSVFFKLTLVENKGSNTFGISPDEFKYFARLRALEVKPPKSWRNHHMLNYGDLVIMSDDIQKSITHSMENALLAANHPVQPIVKIKPSKPKCMSPRGVKLFRYKKPSMGKKRAN